MNKELLWLYNIGSHPALAVPPKGCWPSADPTASCGLQPLSNLSRKPALRLLIDSPRQQHRTAPCSRLWHKPHESPSEGTQAYETWPTNFFFYLPWRSAVCSQPVQVTVDSGLVSLAPTGISVIWQEMEGSVLKANETTCTLNQNDKGNWNEQTVKAKKVYLL